ncbi:MAG: homocysteine S-methyltransferase family protein [Flavobacteriales bacterium]|nr:homocysteine S-methyltransferase family protein [Flavobacteriales bacterium]
MKKERNQEQVLRKIAEERVLILDGAMGTMIQRHQLQEEDYRGTRFAEYPSSLKGNNDLLSITQAKIISDIHEAYLEAGADIIETNTFNSNRISMADYQMEDLVRELNLASAKIALEAAEKYTKINPNRPRFVAGSIGPTNRTASLSPDVNRPGFRSVDFDELKAAYSEQAEALFDGGVDLFLVETVFDTLNAKACLFAIDELFEAKGTKIPVMISGTITDASGRTLSGQTAEAFVVSLEHFNVFSFGFNCALGAKQLAPYIKTLHRSTNTLVSAHPNAGLPNAFGEYDEGPAEMNKQLKDYLDQGLVNILGGCCGTTPEHIKAIDELAAAHSPRKAHAKSISI